MRRPIVPLFVNGLAPPLPLARRCYALGEMLRRALEGWPSDARVAILASGSFSLEIAGPRSDADKPYGVPDQAWVAQVVGLLPRLSLLGLTRAAYSAQMHGLQPPDP
jgi:protocatechuate 4,5-dioxygenase beta chain